MKNMMHMITAACLSLLLLSGCSKVDQAHFDQIKEGMTLDQVQGVLGKPTTSDTANLMGFSTTQAQWKNGDTTINATFTNNTLLVRSFSSGGSANK